MKRVQKGHVTLKCWDLGGQPRFRSMWERYCRGVNAIVFIVDSADVEALPMAKHVRGVGPAKVPVLYRMAI